MEQYIDDDELMKDKYLTFDIDSQIFGLDIQYVLEIIGIQAITKVPNLPYYILGIINLRGKVVPIVDMRLRFGKPGKEFDKKSCIVVVEMDKDVVGLVVDSIDEVRDILSESIDDAGQNEPIGSNKFLQGIAQHEEQVCLILNCHNVLYN